MYILAGWGGGGGSIFWKTPDTALYSTYVSGPIIWWGESRVLIRSVLINCSVGDWVDTA